MSLQSIAMHPISTLRRHLFDQKDVQAFLIGNPASLRYLLGMDCSYGWLLITKTKSICFTDPRYLGELENVGKLGWKLENITEMQRFLTKIQTCCLEGDFITLERLARLKKIYKNTKFVHKSGLLEGLKRKKSSSEMKLLKQAEALTRSVLHSIPSMLTPGITELSLSKKIERWAQEHGADGLSFDTIVAFGENTAKPHHAPTQKKLRKRDIVQIDVGLKVHGYCGDLSEVFFVGQPTAEQKTMHRVLQEVHDECAAMCKPGVRCKDIDALARSMLAKHNWEDCFVHALGHGIGLEVHEAPLVASRSKETLEEGDVVTIEPGVYLLGTYGMRIESMVYLDSQKAKK